MEEDVLLQSQIGVVVFEPRMILVMFVNNDASKAQIVFVSASKYGVYKARQSLTMM